MSGSAEVIRQGIALRRAGDRSSARRVFAEALASDPNDTWARYELVQEFKDGQDLEQALAIAVEGIALPRPSPQLICACADICGELGNTADQLEYLGIAIRRFPGRALPWNHLASTLSDSGSHDQALITLREGFEACSDQAQKDLIAECFAQISSVPYIRSLDLGGWPTEPSHEVLEGALIVQLIKDEADILPDQLRHNYDLGFRHFCIVDNDSQDSTRDAVLDFRNRYKDARVLLIWDWVRQHFQDTKTTAAARFAREYFGMIGARIDWIFPLDADEFLSFSTSGSLAALLGDPGASIISFPLMNYASVLPLDVYPPRGYQLSFPLFDRSYSRRVTKVAYRYNPDAQLHLGNHFVSRVVLSLDEILAAASKGVFLKHYPYRSLQHTEQKILNGYRSLVEFPEVQGGAHWRQNWELYKKYGSPWIRTYLERYIERVSRGIS